MEPNFLPLKQVVKSLLVLVICLILSVPSRAATSFGTPKTTTETTTKTTTKKETMASAAKKNAVSTKTSTKTSTTYSSTSKEKITKKTTVKTTVTTTLKKGSKTKTIKTVVKTSVETTKTPIIITSETTPSFTVNKFEDIKGKINQNVYDSFQKLGFRYIIDPKLSSTGVFNTGNRWIKLKSPNGGYLMHELGHFVSALKQDADNTSEWKSIYDAEKGKYTGSNKAYVTKTAAEYFAESFRDYSENPTSLKKARPRTYTYMDKVVKSINVEEDSKWFYIQYGGYWDTTVNF